VQVGDIDPSEIFVGGKMAEEAEIKDLDGIRLYLGVKNTMEEFKTALKSKLK